MGGFRYLVYKILRDKRKKRDKLKLILQADNEINFCIFIRIFAEDFQLEICKKFYITRKKFKYKI